MLTNPRDAFRGQSRSAKHSTYVTYSFLLVCNSNFVFKTRHFSDIRLSEKRRVLKTTNVAQEETIPNIWNDTMFVDLD